MEKLYLIVRDPDHFSNETLKPVARAAITHARLVPTSESGTKGAKMN